MEDKNNAFGPLFMDILWNGLLYYSLKLHWLFEMILVSRTADVADIYSMSILETVRIKEKNERSVRRKQECMLFMAHMLSTLLWMCEVSIDPQGNLRIDGGVRRNQLYEMFSSTELDHLFIDKFAEYLKTKKRLVTEQVDAVEVYSVTPTAKKHPSMKTNPLVSVISCYRKVSTDFVTEFRAFNLKSICFVQLNVHSEDSESDSDDCASGPPEGRLSQYRPVVLSQCASMGAPGGVRDPNDSGSSSGNEECGADGEERGADGEEESEDEEERRADGEGAKDSRAQICSYAPCNDDDAECELKDCHLCKKKKLHANCFFRSKLYQCYSKRNAG